MSFSKLSHSLREKVSPFTSEEDPELKIKCINCRTKERLFTFRDLHRGSHICMGGRRLMFTVGDHQVSAYTHHAIVKSTRSISDSTAMVTLLHFYTTPYDMTVRIQETTELLNLKYHEINVIRYRHPTHQPDTIIERAERLIAQNKQEKYSVFSCNCEHICNWCCIGNAKSFQADSAKAVFSDILTDIAGGKCLGIACRLILLSLEDASKVTSSCLIGAPWGVLSALAVFYLIYVVYQHFKLNKDRSKGIICSTCTRRKKIDIWSQFIAYCGLQTGGLWLLSLVISVGASHGIILGSLLVCSLLSFVCISAVPKLRKIFLSPFQARMLKIRSMKNIWIGDVVSFQHKNMSNYSIVSAVKIFPGSHNKKGMLTIIHYSQPSIFGRRKIVEEDKTIDLDKETLIGHDYSPYYEHEPEVVVKRARQRLGETKFNVISNRSCHFCHWAKVLADGNDEINDEDNTVEKAPVFVYLREVDLAETVSALPTQSVHIDHTRGRKQTSKSIGKVWARIRDDVKEGQLIEFKHRRLCHKAVTTNVQFDVKILSKLSVTLVHYGKERKICEETIVFDLNHEDIWIYKFHPLYMHKKTDIINRARARISDGKYNIIQQISSNFTRDVVAKGHISTVLDMREIVPGDVISFPYWSFSHEAIVSDITRQGTEAKSAGKVTIIHYGVEKVFAQRTIKEETISIDLRKGRLSLMNYEGYVTYPSDIVIERARSRIGEQRFSICGNTSADFVHWAKVIQCPAIMSEFHRSHSSKFGMRLLLPQAGRRVEEFQRFSVRTWSELSPGVIVEYRPRLLKIQGILSNVSEKEGMIKVIQYGTDKPFAQKTIREESVKIDLRRDDIWIYRGHPRRCFKTGDVVDNALRRLGEKKTDKGNSAWEFCKECVLKPMTP